MKHIISVMLENEPGALSRVVGLFSARGYNIERLMVVPDKEPGLSRITMVARCGPDTAQQIIGQLHKQIDVISVEMTDKEIAWPTSTISSTPIQA